MLRLTDLRKTTRRSGGADVRVVYPTFLRDRALAPRIELAVRYLESMLGRPRRDLDTEVVVQLLGDHKVARCVVYALATSYQHRPRRFDEVLLPDQVASLAAWDLYTPSDLRLWLYTRANAELYGFVGGPERAPFLRAAGDALGIPPERIDELAALDAPANAVLVRTGPLPTADDVIARFNYATAAALLANSSLVRLSLRQAPGDPAVVSDLCALAGVRASLSGRELVLHGRQDALDSWARHGARLARLCSTLLACGLPVRAGEATVAAPGGVEWLFRLDDEILTFLGGLGAGATWCEAAAAEVWQAWRRADALAGEFAARRQAGEGAGWSLRRASEPVVAAGAVVPALFIGSREAQRVPLVLPGAAGAARVRDLAGRLPLVVLDMVLDVAVAAESEAGPGTHGAQEDGARNMLPLRLHYAARADAEALPALLTQAAELAEGNAARVRLEAACAEARTAGVVTEARLVEWLGCAEEEVAARLDEPAARAVREAQRLRYVEGFGLCSVEVLARAQAAAADVASLRGDQPVGAAWTARVLGRRLREVTGASEGIECLIAYLGAA